jgi:hypothetical protein
MSTPSHSPRPAKPVPAGICDYLLSGHHYTAADREAAEKALALAPEGRLAALENRAFLQRAVRYIAQHGVRQYIDIGSGFPTAGPVHAIASEIVPDPHVVYVDYEPTVAELCRTLVRSPHVVTVVHDLRHPWHIIDDPEVAQRWPGSSTGPSRSPCLWWPSSISSHLVRIRSRSSRRSGTTWSGSYLVLSHAAHRENPDAVEEAARAWDNATSRLTLRTPHRHR